MRVVAEDRSTGLRHCAIDNPIVAAAHHTEATELFDLLVLLQHTKVDALVGNAGWDDERMARIIADFQFCRTLNAQFGDQASTNKLGFPVATEVPALHFGPLNSIDRTPGLRFEA